jgi:hypothetical protein
LETADKNVFVSLLIRWDLPEFVGPKNANLKILGLFGWAKVLFKRGFYSFMKMGISPVLVKL